MSAGSAGSAPEPEPRRPLRVAVVAPNFAEYSVRLAAGLAEAEPGLRAHAFVDRAAFARDATDQLRATARGRATPLDLQPRGAAARGWGLLRAVAQVALFRPDVIQVHEHADRPTTLLYRALARLAPLVLLVHDPEPHSGRDAQYAARQARFTTAQRALARAFVVHGEHCRASAAARIALAGRPLVSIRHGAILTPPTAPERVGEPWRVLMFGRMEAYKGLDVLLEAARRLQARGAPLQLELMGRGPALAALREDFAALADVEVVDRFVSADEAVAAFGRAALVVAPYRDATQSGVVAAALENGRPVVASALGGLSEAVEDGVDGILTAPGDAQALADALEAVLGDPARLEALTAGARTRGRGRLAWSLVAAPLVPLYRALA